MEEKSPNAWGRLRNTVLYKTKVTQRSSYQFVSLK